MTDGQTDRRTDEKMEEKGKETNSQTKEFKTNEWEKKKIDGKKERKR